MPIYKVKAKDTLWKIAKKFSVSMDSIVRLNNIKKPDKIKTGIQLNIPDTTTDAMGGKIMARRYTGNMNGEQYLGNTNKKEVHDLDNEKTAANECQIDEIIRAVMTSPSFRSPQHMRPATTTAPTVWEVQPANPVVYAGQTD